MHGIFLRQLSMLFRSGVAFSLFLLFFLSFGAVAKCAAASPKSDVVCDVAQARHTPHVHSKTRRTGKSRQTSDKTRGKVWLTFGGSFIVHIQASVAFVTTVSISTRNIILSFFFGTFCCSYMLTCDPICNPTKIPQILYLRFRRRNS